MKSWYLKRRVNIYYLLIYYMLIVVDISINIYIFSIFDTYIEVSNIYMYNIYI